MLRRKLCNRNRLQGGSFFCGHRPIGKWCEMSHGAASMDCVQNAAGGEDDGGVAARSEVGIGFHLNGWLPFVVVVMGGGGEL